MCWRTIRRGIVFFSEASNAVFSVVVVIGVVDVVVVVVVVVIVGVVVVVGVVCWCFALSTRIVDHGCFSSIISVRICVFSFRFFVVPSIRLPCAACKPTRRRQLQFAHSIPVVVCLFVRFYICACFCLWWAHLVNICVYGAFGLCVSRSVSTVIVGVVV